MSATSYNGGYLFASDTSRSHDMAMWALESFVAHKAFYHATKSKKDFEGYMERVLPQAAHMVSCEFHPLDDILVFVIKAVFRNGTIWGEGHISPQGRVFNITKCEEPTATK